MSGARIFPILVLLSAMSAAQSAEPWAGKRLIVKRAGVELGHTQDGRWVSLGVVNVLAVSALDERGNWLLVRTDERTGWMPRTDAIPCKEAVAYYSQLIRDEPNREAHHLRRATAYHETGNFDLAITDFTTALKLDPQSHVAYNGRAVARHLSKRYEDALSDYSEAIRLHASDGQTFANRAWLLATCPDARYRDGKKAVEDASKACELTEWKHPDCIENLAAAMAEAGKFEEAVRFQKKALEFPEFEKENGVKARERIKLFAGRKPYRTDGGD